MYNPHLGLINAAPPLFWFLLQTTFFTIHLLSKKARNLLNFGQDFINLTGDTSSSSWGSSWGSSICPQSETPKK